MGHASIARQRRISNRSGKHPVRSPGNRRTVSERLKMLSADTNLFIHAADPDSPQHQRARKFFFEIQNADFVLCELVLVELYMQLRNSAIFVKPYTSREAVNYCRILKQNPAWRMIDYAPEISEHLWQWAEKSNVGFRQIIDARLALTLRHHGVDDFATANLRDFRSFGFRKVWNPLVI
jgi:uncharacterized protein